MHGMFLDSLKSMYETMQLCVRVEGDMVECFESDIGLQQGDSLSPLLFGLFIDLLEKIFDGMLGPELFRDIWLKVLLYADDVIG